MASESRQSARVGRCPRAVFHWLLAAADPARLGKLALQRGARRPCPQAAPLEQPHHPCALLVWHVCRPRRLFHVALLRVAVVALDAAPLWDRRVLQGTRPSLPLGTTGSAPTWSFLAPAHRGERRRRYSGLFIVEQYNLTPPARSLPPNSPEEGPEADSPVWHTSFFFSWGLVLHAVPLCVAEDLS